MFDIHKVKPVHGWREFLGEVGIIVLGVLIALAAESAIEEWRWHEQAEQTRSALRKEILEGSVNALERVAIDSCLRSDLANLLRSLTAESGVMRGHPVAYWRPTPEFSVVPPAYGAPTRPYIFDSWKNALASGVFNHLNAQEKMDYAELAISMDELSNMQRQEGNAITRLAPLSFDSHPDRRLRSEYIADLAMADKQQHDTVIYARFFLDTVRGMRLGFTKSDVDAAVKNMLDDERTFRGQCVRKLTLNLG